MDSAKNRIFVADRKGVKNEFAKSQKGT
jgi:hypothetical protein